MQTDPAAAQRLIAAALAAVHGGAFQTEAAEEEESAADTGEGQDGGATVASVGGSSGQGPVRHVSAAGSTDDTGAAEAGVAAGAVK